MSLFANYRADRLIAEVKSSGNPSGPLAQKALEKLAALGSDAIDPIVDALATSEKKESLAYVEVLSKLIDSKTLPDSAENHVGGQWPRHVRHRLGAVLQQELSGRRTARRLKQAGDAQAGTARCDCGAESAITRCAIC